MVVAAVAVVALVVLEGVVEGEVVHHHLELGCLTQEDLSAVLRVQPL